MPVISMREYSRRAKKAWRTKRAKAQAKLEDYQRRARKAQRTKRAS